MEIKILKSFEELQTVQDILFKRAVALDLFYIRRKIECCDGCFLIIGPSASNELEYFIIKDNHLYNSCKNYLEKWYS